MSFYFIPVLVQFLIIPLVVQIIANFPLLVLVTTFCWFKSFYIIHLLVQAMSYYLPLVLVTVCYEVHVLC